MENKETLSKRIEDIPKLRFPEFEEKWKEILLSEIADKVVDKNNNLQYKEIFTNSAEYGVVSQKDFFVNDIITPVNLNKYYIVKENDFVYNPRISNSAPVGPININKLNKIGIMSPLYLIFHTHDIDTIYLENFFKSNHWHSYMLFNGNSGARLDRFSIKDSVFFDMQIFVPSYLEQQKIGTFLSKVDSLIRLYEKKLILLNKYKEGLYKAIFSNISVESKISLKDIIMPLKKTFHKSGDGKADGKYIFFTNTTSENFKYFDSYDYDEEVIIANTGGTANFKYYKGKFAAMSDCYIFKTSENTQYIYYWLDYMKDIIDRLGFRGNGIKHLDKRWFLSLTLGLPSFTEQTKIVNLLNSFDSIIYKETQTLNQLQKMKSGLLQQMFI